MMTEQANTIWLRMAIQLALMQRAIRDSRTLTASCPSFQDQHDMKLPLVNDEPANFMLDALERQWIAVWK